MNHRYATTAVLVLLLSACASSPDTAQEAEESNPLLDITQYDESTAERCIQIAQIRSSRILDSQSIEFKLTGDRTYLNVLPRKCPGMRANQPFAYSTSQSVLCNVDLITLLEPGLGMRTMGRCGLGMFYPIDAAAGPVVSDEDEPEE